MVPYLREIIGTALLIILGDGAVANVVLKNTKGHGGSWIVITFGWAMGVFVGVFSVGAISGAHINPAVTVALAFYHRYHSLRYVRDRLAIRLSSPIQLREVDGLKERFSDILSPPHEFFFSPKALPEEADEPGISHLPRLVFTFNRRDFGRLRQLIDHLNNM